MAVIVPADTPAETRARSRSAPRAANCSPAAELFDLYTGEGIPPGTKSLAFALTYQAPDRTLGEKEIAKAAREGRGPAASRLEGADPRQGLISPGVHGWFRCPPH